MPTGDPMIREIEAGTEDEWFVATCSHVGESEEIDACARHRQFLFQKLREQGARFKTATVDNAHAGFIYGVPIESASWGAVGENVMMIPCLYVVSDFSRHGLGRSLVEAVETDARDAGMEGVAVTAYRYAAEDFWFMPAAFFDELGFEEIERRGSEVLLWKPFRSDAAAPKLLQPNWSFEPAPGKVVVDLFWNAFCPTSGIEAQRVREVASEFADDVIVREHQAEDRSKLLVHQTPRAIYINGVEIGWGYEAPREGIRQAIQEALLAV